MRILAAIHRAEGVDINGRTIHRTAARAVILRGESLLMVYSSAVGDYKFLGGGVKVGETHTQALHHEVREECGMELIRVGDEVGAVVEYNLPMEPEYDAFKMTSHYYHCDVEDGFGLQKLDDYERDLGFEPVWISIAEALRQNRALLHSERPPEWLRREIFILEYLLAGR